MQTPGQAQCKRVVSTDAVRWSSGVQFRSYEMFDFDMGYEWLEKTGRRGSMSDGLLLLRRNLETRKHCRAAGFVVFRLPDHQ